MAIVAVLFGGMLGFVAAVAALLLGASLASAVTLWVVTGLVAVALAGVFALSPRHEPAPQKA
ncbi:hypothetical protein LHP98_10080 [Rhodobacter sp. Har01]|uniref:hypothetical protein n=1 Tax=Rhodobacter sp. Har01 TaxID=2883999 RepID=UPI001D082414|nr:hypothetical protein [Rhodobacter sp. Har01]MCB6178478.1 hypothetical protein [Rhodobacter sp. Har01]